MKEIEVLAPAKINLFLKILSKRKDGYHDIETVFEKISLFDKIIIKDNLEDKIIVESNSKKLSQGKDNSIFKAAAIIKDKFRINKGLHIYLEKNIPLAAGLGGGSSDAAAVLKGLNKFWRLGLSKDNLLNFAKKIGCDVPLFILEDSFLLGRERGDKLFRIPGSEGVKLWHILIVPNFGVSSPYAYALFDKHCLGNNKRAFNGNNQEKLRLTMPNYGVNIITYSLLNRDVSLLNYYSYNSFQNLIIRQFPVLGRIKKILERRADNFVHMSGSGSTLFVTLSNREEAEYLRERIGKDRGINKYHCFLVYTY